LVVAVVVVVYFLELLVFIIQVVFMAVNVVVDFDSRVVGAVLILL